MYTVPSSDVENRYASSAEMRSRVTGPAWTCRGKAERGERSAEWWGVGWAPPSRHIAWTWIVVLVHERELVAPDRAVLGGGEEHAAGGGERHLGDDAARLVVTVDVRVGVTGARDERRGMRMEGRGGGEERGSGAAAAGGGGGGGGARRAFSFMSDPTA